MQTFINHFFSETYSDNLGEGSFGYRHIIWMIATVILCIAIFQYFKRYPKQAKPFILFFCAALFIFRLFNQIYRAAVGIENPAWEAIPWHLCTVMTFLIPIVEWFNLKKLKPFVLPLGFIGGTVTIFFGQYFDSKFMTLFTFEGMWAHTLLVLIMLIEIATGQFKLEFKNYWKTVVGMMMITGWAALADLVFFKNYSPNYTEMMVNQLGFSIPHINFRWIYIAIFFIFITAMYGIPTLYRNAKKTKIKTQTNIEAIPKAAL